MLVTQPYSANPDTQKKTDNGHIVNAHNLDRNNVIEFECDEMFFSYRIKILHRREWSKQLLFVSVCVCASLFHESEHLCLLFFSCCFIVLGH